MALQNNKYIYSVITQIILVIVLTFFPNYYVPINLAGTTYFSTFSAGYYIAIIFQIFSLVINIMRVLRKRDTANNI